MSQSVECLRSRPLENRELHKLATRWREGLPAPWIPESSDQVGYDRPFFVYSMTMEPICNFHRDALIDIVEIPLSVSDFDWQEHFSSLLGWRKNRYWDHSYFLMMHYFSVELKHLPVCAPLGEHFYLTCDWRPGRSWDINHECFSIELDDTPANLEIAAHWFLGFFNAMGFGRRITVHSNQNGLMFHATPPLVARIKDYFRNPGVQISGFPDPSVLLRVLNNPFIDPERIDSFKATTWCDAGTYILAARSLPNQFGCHVKISGEFSRHFKAWQRGRIDLPTPGLSPVGNVTARRDHVLFSVSICVTESKRGWHLELGTPLVNRAFRNLFPGTSDNLEWFAKVVFPDVSFQRLDRDEVLQFRVPLLRNRLYSPDWNKPPRPPKNRGWDIPWLRSVIPNTTVVLVEMAPDHLIKSFRNSGVIYNKILDLKTVAYHEKDYHRYTHCVFRLRGFGWTQIVELGQANKDHLGFEFWEKTNQLLQKRLCWYKNGNSVGSSHYVVLDNDGTVFEECVRFGACDPEGDDEATEQQLIKNGWIYSLSGSVRMRSKRLVVPPLDEVDYLKMEERLLKNLGIFIAWLAGGNYQDLVDLVNDDCWEWNDFECIQCVILDA